MTPGASFVLPVDKPEGPTSHDVVDAARRALGVRRIGHTGTLDPFASGLLLLCVGQATRLAEYLSGLDKTYVAVARLGVATDSHDRDGEVVEVREGWAELTRDDVDRVLPAFVGEIDQVPPQHSAKKVDGVRMHRRARGGERVALPPSRVTVHELDLVELRPPEVHLRVRCSSGTYVRALARDLGEALGVGAHLTALRRVSIGAVRVDAAIGVDALGDAEAVAAARIEPLRALAHLPTVHVGGDAAARLAHGQTLPVDAAAVAGTVAVEAGGALVAVAELRGGVLRPRKVLAP